MLVKRDIFRHRQVWKDAQVLVYHAHACRHRLPRQAACRFLSVQDNLAAGIYANDTGDYFDHRGLPASILADQAVDFPLIQREIHVLKCMNASIVLVHFFQFNYFFHVIPLFAKRSGSGVPQPLP